MGYLTVFLLALVCHCLLMTFADEEQDDYDTMQWEAFKAKYNKTYSSPGEEKERREAFEKNQHDHFMHNLNDTNNYTVGIHEHSDKEPEDAIDILCGTEVPAGEANDTSPRSFSKTERLNQDSVDWVTAGKVTSVKNQGSCGSCWAFTAAQALESQAAIKWNGLWDISEQQLVDCASSYGNNGCNGGWPNNAFNYMIKEGGEMMDSCYSYTGKEGTCKKDDNCYHFQVASYTRVASGDENAVANALAQYGPMAIAIYVNDKFMSYSSGIFSSDDCQKQVNHGVVLVGYGTENGQDFWKIKNSWGPGWGENGYIRIARNKGNMCQVATYASYPTLA